MAANSNSKVSAIPSPEESLAQVSRDSLGVKVQLGSRGGETIAAVGDNLPFAVVRSDGNPPEIKTYGSLFGCHGGTLTAGETVYRIQVFQQQWQQQQQQANAQLPPAKRHKHGDHEPVTQMPPIPATPLPDHYNYDETHPPRFLCRDEWLQGIINTIDAFLPFDERDKKNRIPPLAISRCSRGGKTRALHEIALALQERKKRGQCPLSANLLMVGFGGNISPLKNEEKEAPLFALTRRIAFALSNVPRVAGEFDKFRPLEISEEQVRGWLGKGNWLLLIDNLNNLDLRKEDLRAGNTKVAVFLKSDFLVQPGRYFVFSTHEIATGSQLCNYMETKNDRGAKMKPLPLIPSLTDTLNAFKSEMEDPGKLNARLALFCGLVPGLIYLELCGQFPTTRRQKVLKAFLDRRPTDEDMVVVLGTVLEGTHTNLEEYPELLQLMDTTEANEVRWIPHHMKFLLEHVANSQQRAQLSKPMRDHLKKMCELFDLFCTARSQSGDAWEALFVLLVLIRVVTSKGSDLLHLSEYFHSSPPTDYHTKFNSPIQMQEGKTFKDISGIEELLECINEADVQEPTVGIYFPTHAQFETYDLIVRKWGNNGAVLKTYGYQLKEGKEIPGAESSDWCDHSYVIRGKAAESKIDLRKWHVASKDQIGSFFGTSGAEWTPEKWLSLKNSG